jgi:hypothetical protein
VIVLNLKISRKCDFFFPIVYLKIKKKKKKKEKKKKVMKRPPSSCQPRHRCQVPTDNIIMDFRSTKIDHDHLLQRHNPSRLITRLQPPLLICHVLPSKIEKDRPNIRANGSQSLSLSLSLSPL